MYLWVILDFFCTHFMSIWFTSIPAALMFKFLSSTSYYLSIAVCIDLDISSVTPEVTLFLVMLVSPVL